jgi:DNA-binding MarR family transcriptional regulator
MTREELQECPFYLITRASLAITARLRRELTEAGVGTVRPSYLGVLMSLWQEDGLKVVELGRRAGLEPSTMTGLLDRMERDGLVARTPDPDDRRAQRVRLSDEGRQMDSVVNRIVDEALEQLLHGLGEPEIDGMKQALRQVLANTDRGAAS